MNIRLTDFIKQHVLSHFGLQWLELGDTLTLSPLGNGHINATFLVKWPQGAMVLQKINTHVFTCPKSVMDNLHLVYQSLVTKAQVQSNSHTQYQLSVARPLLTQSQQLMLDLGEKGVWRALEYIESSHCIEEVETPEQAEIAARAFAHFSRHLMMINPEKMQEVIPDFHHLAMRLAQLNARVKSDPHNRLQACQHWVDFINSQTDLIKEVHQTLPTLPKRICHNDTKINNLLFNKQDMTALAVIDLDTCMSGYLLYDFGDMVRTFCSTVEEDSTELNQLKVSEPIFAALCQGYLSELGEVITAAEKQSLWLGARLMCFMLGVRFLADYLVGDHYFTIQSAEHNLQRAANQLTLYKNLLTQEAHFIRYLSAA
ncbi:aminoglycoside phosphotransferase family protein [uncultured Shewanella sp.]|uniref:phosphotransferase enzyme family protein n=1 Tax=uncultured Shewanella sp. TaxID=173975 RepID=UPI002615CBE4|nr:aminoglycoside phosphotransferase family protein [uncultured Shewanella sp.]